MIIAYVKSSTGSQSVCEIQKEIINRYAVKHHFNCTCVFEDCGKVKRGVQATRLLQAKGFTELREYDKVYSSWEKMLCFIIDNPVKAILVDMKSRLHMMEKQNKIFESICAEKGIRIIEAIDDEPGENVGSKKIVALYHFTNQSKNRPIILEKEIDKMYEHVSQQKCWDIPYVFVDYSLKKSAHEKYNSFRRCVSRFDVLLVTDYFHIEDKLGTFITELSYLKTQGIEVVSLKEGKVSFTNLEILSKPLSVAVYGRLKDISDRQLEIDRFETFIEYRTNWNNTSVYMEENLIERDEEQKKLHDLLKEANRYDLILVKKFNHFHWRTSMFFKLAQQAKIPIYSMMEGGLYFAL